MTLPPNGTPSTADLPPPNGGKPPDQDGDKVGENNTIVPETEVKHASNVTGTNTVGMGEVVKQIVTEKPSVGEKTSTSLSDTMIKGETSPKPNLKLTSEEHSIEAQDEIVAELALNYTDPAKIITIQTQDKAQHIQENRKPGWNGTDSKAYHDPQHIQWFQEHDLREAEFEKKMQLLKHQFFQEQHQRLKTKFPKLAIWNPVNTGGTQDHTGVEHEDPTNIKEETSESEKKVGGSDKMLVDDTDKNNTGEVSQADDNENVSLSSNESMGKHSEDVDSCAESNSVNGTEEENDFEFSDE